MPRLVVGAVVLLLALSGCGGDPKADPSSSTSETPSPTATPSAPTMPEAAKADTKAGAIAFVRYYVELVNHAQMTGDIAPLEAVEGPACTSCKQGRNYLAKIYGAGGHIEGGTWSITRATAASSGENWAVTVEGEFAPSDAFATADATPDHAKGGLSLTNFIVWHDGQWKVRTWFSG